MVRCLMHMVRFARHGLGHGGRTWMGHGGPPLDEVWRAWNGAWRAANRRGVHSMAGV